MKQKYVSFSRGAQFHDGKSAYIAVILLFFIILIFVLLPSRMFVEALFLFCVSIVLLFYMLDFRGVDIDRVKNRIRLYEVNVWGKSGRWMDYKNYMAVTIEYDSFRTKEDSHEGRIGMSSVNVVNRRFLISVVNDNPEKTIVLMESENYWDGKKMAIVAAKRLNLVFLDKHHENTIRMQKTRRR